ncbi:hypothetical protein ASU33_12980 [Solirubrum puertoriconensis]|uniref:Cytochrome c domain-containing protein n=2 Tax=Solirubrum puertoriconensis TaxID=1751427 RepID=A0A9X0HJU3_SOLP1|nr:hypothetical protein ASU33_12980 [Solirubrum puertoriconensis]
MSRNALELVFPAAAMLLVCSLVVLFLTGTGLQPGLTFSDESSADKSEQMNDTTQAFASAESDSLDTATVQFSLQDLEAAAAGDALFKNNCAQCHAINDVVVGPALAGLTQRRAQPWVVKWVQNSSKMVASGDEYAVKIFNEYQKQQMPSFALTEEQIGQIIKYIEVEGSKGMIRETFAVAD